MWEDDDFDFQLYAELFNSELPNRDETMKVRP